jgi:hypothetical protein
MIITTPDVDNPSLLCNHGICQLMTMVASAAYEIDDNRP